MIEILEPSVSMEDGQACQKTEDQIQLIRKWDTHRIIRRNEERQISNITILRDGEIRIRGQHMWSLFMLYCITAKIHRCQNIKAYLNMKEPYLNEIWSLFLNVIHIYRVPAVISNICWILISFKWYLRTEKLFSGIFFF